MHYSRAARAVTLIEVLAAIAIISLLLGLLLPSLADSKQAARKIQCKNNLRQFAAADTMYMNDYGVFPQMSPFVPTSISVARLRQIGSYFGLTLPSGEAISWPKRPSQPSWINCPFAQNSGYAEGLTVGGGLYTGYAYFGGLEESELVRNGLGTVANKGHAAENRGGKFGVLWSDVLTEFPTVEQRRYEVFHLTKQAGRYRDFRFHAWEVDGIHRGWSDGSVDWLPGTKVNLNGIGSPDLRLQTFLGNYYF